MRRLLLILRLSLCFLAISSQAQTVSTSAPAMQQLPPSTDDEPDPRDNEIAVDVSTLSKTPTTLPSAQAIDPALVLRIGCDRFAGTNLSHPDFSPDGHEIVLTNIADTRIFEVASGRLRATLPSARETLFINTDRLAQRLFEDIHIVDRSGAILKTLNVHRPEKMAVSSDGKRLAIATAWVRTPPGSHTPSPEPSVTLWNIETGEQVADLGPVFHKTEPVRGQPNAYWMLDSGTSIGFGANQTLMTIAADGHVKLWDALTGQPKKCADIVIDPAVPATLALDGKSIVLPDATPRQIDLATGVASPLPFLVSSTNPSTPTTKPSLVRRNPARSRPGIIYGKIAFSRDGQVLSCLLRGTLRRWNLQSGKELSVIDRGLAGLDAGLSPDGKSIAVITSGQLDIVDADTATSRFSPATPETTVRSFIPTRDGTGLFVADQGGSIYRFDLNTGELRAWRKRGKSATASLLPVEAFEHSADDDLIWAFNYNSTVTARDSRTLAPAGEPTALSLVPPYAVSSDGTTAAGYSTDGDYEFTSLTPTTQPVSVQTLGPRIRRSSTLAISPDHHRLAIADPYLLSTICSDPAAANAVQQQYFSTPHSRSGEQPADAKAIELPDSFACSAIQYSPDGRFIFGISHDGPIAFDAEQLTVRWLVSDPTTNSQGRPMCLSDDGRLMAYANPNGIAIVDTDDGRIVTTLPMNSNSVRGLEFVPGTTRVIVLRDGRTIEIWDWRIVAEKSFAADPVATTTTADLIGSDQPADAYRALFTLMRHPPDLLNIAAALDGKKSTDPFQPWIAGLSSNDSAERERCHHQLERAGTAAATDIRSALGTAKPGEARDRLQALNDLLDDGAKPADDDDHTGADPTRRHAARIIEGLDWSKSADAQIVLRKLTNDADIDVAALAKIALAHKSLNSASPR